jgi:hypothetical protein
MKGLFLANLMPIETAKVKIDNLRSVSKMNGVIPTRLTPDPKPHCVPIRPNVIVQTIRIMEVISIRIPEVLALSESFCIHPILIIQVVINGYENPIQLALDSGW